MWIEFFRFDLRHQLRQPLLWAVTVALVLVAFMTAGSESFRIGGEIGNMHLNAPVVIARQLSILTMIAMFLVTVFIAGAILRDNEVGIADLLFATPMRKTNYLFGRFLAGFAVCVALFALITLAMMGGSAMASADPERMGAFSLHPYAWSFAVFVVPNLLFIAALLMLLAATTRSMIMVYVGVLAFTVLWGMGFTLGQGSNGESLAVLLDPFGIRALMQLTRYFTAAQANSQLPPLAGVLLLNRLIWMGAALAMVAATVALFKPQRAGTGKRWFGAASAASPATPAARVPAVRRIAPRFDAWTAVAQWWQVLCFDARGVIRSLPFLIMLLLALANFFTNYAVGGMRFDSIPYPLTRIMLEELSGSINAMLVIVLIFFSGELVFRERQVRIAGLNDAMPVPDWVPLAAKAGALVAVVFVFLGVGALAGVAIQLAVGGAPVEGLLYVKGTLINSIYFVLMGCAAISVQVITNNKYLGYLVAIALMLAETLLSGLNVEHRLASFASLPPLVYSDLNGYGHYLAGWSWFALYWGLAALALLIVAQAFTVRGLAPRLRGRTLLAVRAMKGRKGAALALCVAGWMATGGWIWYNTTVLRPYEPAGLALDLRADYEKLYRKYLAQPDPSITAVRADVDIYPDQRSVDIRGHYVAQNKTGAAMDSLRIQTDRTAETIFHNLPAHTVVLDDRRLCFMVIALREPLAAGASMAVDFTVRVRNPGFSNSGAPELINGNGSMFTSENFFPKFGYAQHNEIEERHERRARGLGEPHRLNDLDDKAAHARNFWKVMGWDADLMDFETTVSTSADQVAISPGYLLRSWEKDGRRYFHYKMDKQILPFFSYQSGRWEVTKAAWRGMPIEVYHDPKHTYNIDRMVKGTQRALDYFSEHFGPYQHKQVRITEFPLYQQYARSFPNTIPFSESLGFINDLRNPDGVDHVFYVTAHEIAHQWWGDQVIAANVQGNPMITESLAEYSALMALEKEYGAAKTRHILRWDLDKYFEGRAKELVEERPLFRDEGQDYIHYRKGSLAFYRLREEIGEAALNGALKRFRDENLYKTAPYVTSRDLLRYLRAAAPADKQELITDLFERIVFYDNRLAEASAKKRKDGRWDVTMTVRLAKLQADGKGKETARAYDEAVDIAVLAGERVLFREKRMLPGGESTLTVTVNEKPSEAGVDPYNILIDRVASDNRKPIAVE
ncbi:ABC transporter permease/M1 family aminopeptidase [Pseudoduganella sp. GCM10020061]|uniref:ABC transporter permease/M1 family aminopeptidase n=1 Tax=Pseudoduganella sp. GCM10020061 TaxID=3317345 RepID=UPI00362CD7EF